MEHYAHHRYDPPVVDGMDFSDSPSMAQQEFKEECDINRIMARYLATGVAPEGVGVGRFGDFSEVPDFIEAQNIVIEATKQFEALPAKVRDYFKNDPAAFLEYVHSDKVDLDKCVEWGILSEEAVKRVASEKAASKKAYEDKIAADAVARYEDEKAKKSSK